MNELFKMLPVGLIMLVEVSLVGCAATHIGQRTEDFSSDPGWIGDRNRLIEPNPPTVSQDFGWSSTNFAGFGAGEMGGAVWRSVQPAHYAKVIEPLTFNDPISCSGTLTLLHSDYLYGWQTGSTVFVGFFNEAKQGWRPPNFIGFRIEATDARYPVDERLSWEGVGLDPAHPPLQAPLPSKPESYVVNPASLEFSYGTAAYVANGFGSGGLSVFPDGKPHTWSFSYDPKGGDGHGAITLIWDGGEPVTTDLASGQRAQGAIMDRFGIFNYQQPGGKMIAYFDDVTINGELEDFAKDPGWEAHGNHRSFVDPVQYGINDFGYSPTGFASGEPGEIGGRFWRADVIEDEFKGSYGDDIGLLTLNERLFAQGKISVPHFSIDSGMNIGWYNSKEQGWPPKNFVGANFDSLTDTGRIFIAMLGTSQAELLGVKGDYSSKGAASTRQYLNLLPDGKPHDFSMDYDPEANGGLGVYTLTLDGASATIELEPGFKEQGALFDRFGFFNMQDNNGKDCLIYLDDLTYTVGNATESDD